MSPPDGSLGYCEVQGVPLSSVMSLPPHGNAVVQIR